MCFRLVIWIVLFGAGMGCRSAGERENAAAAANPSRPGRVISAEVVEPEPVVRPADIIQGRVITVQDRYRFVVIDFPNSRLPQLDQQLSVFRLDQKVAEVRISGPYLNTTVAADITAGSVKPGDIVRLP